MKFEELEINKNLLRGIEDMGFEEATPIQEQSINAILQNRDMIGQAQTGTGKTAAYGIPVIDRIDPQIRAVQAVVLCPTRELAVQVSDEFHKLCKYLHSIKTVPVYGGSDIVRQIRALKGGAQIIIATPGRLMDHIRRKTVKFDEIRMIILDEADEMLNMGFREDIETILTAFPPEIQKIMFSATMPAPIMEIAKTYQKEPLIVKIQKKELTVENIEQLYYEVKAQDKQEVLSRLLDINKPKLGIIFCNTKRQVDELVNNLQSRGYAAEGLHGDMQQQSRDRVMANCRSGRTKLLVATDVAARGIDIENVDVVFNYDLPQDEEYYVHRIGRTGRAGRSGKSLSFVVGKEIYKLHSIERYCKTVIAKGTIPTLMDVTNCKIESLGEELLGILQSSNMDSLRSAVEEMTTEEFSSTDLAAALLYKSTLANNSEIEVPAPYRRGREREGRDSSRRSRSEKGMTRLFISIGKRDNLRTGDIVGAIAGESKISGSAIGAINIFDNYSFADVPQELAGQVISSMKKKKIKGRPVTVEAASDRPHHSESRNHRESRNDFGKRSGHRRRSN